MFAALILVFAGQFVVAGTARAAYPGANGRIAFVRDGYIWTVWPNGAAPRRLTFKGNSASPVWSPDGRLIAFQRIPRLGPGSWDIWVMRANGSHLRRITSALSNETSPTWSPDGRWIAFSSDRGSTADLSPTALFKRRSRAPYGNAIRLTNPEVEAPYFFEVDTEAVWSPLGGKIMFTAYGVCDCGTGSALSTVPTDGGSTTRVPTTLGGDTWRGDWAPNGREYALTTDADDPGNPDDGIDPDIYMRSSNGTIHRVTALDTENPAWSPNGTRIAYQDMTSGSIWTIRPDGTGARFVISNASEPDWQPLVG